MSGVGESPFGKIQAVGCEKMFHPVVSPLLFVFLCFQRLVL